MTRCSLRLCYMTINGKISLCVEKRRKEGDKNIITLEWAHKQVFLKTVHTCMYFSHNIRPQIAIKKTIFTKRVWRFLVMFWWWRHNRLHNALCDLEVVKRVHDMKCDNSYISIVFMWIFTADRLRNHGPSPIWNRAQFQQIWKHNRIQYPWYYISSPILVSYFNFYYNVGHNAPGWVISWDKSGIQDVAFLFKLSTATPEEYTVECTSLAM